MKPWQESLIVRDLGRADYHETWRAMRGHALTRDAAAPDEFWLAEHAPLYTLGQRGPAPATDRHEGLPLIKTDRGGDITYHGPGQAIVYLLIDLRRRGLSVRQLVCLMEESVVALLADYDIRGTRREGAPGIYVDGEKIASLGLRVRRGCTYHGLALNIDMGMEPFTRIKPCGLSGVTAIQLRDLVPTVQFDEVRAALVDILTDVLGYAPRNAVTETQRRIA